MQQGGYTNCVAQSLAPPLRITPQQEEEILEPLVPSILANLEHRHSYVRRNAVLAINQLYK